MNDNAQLLKKKTIAYIFVLFIFWIFLFLDIQKQHEMVSWYLILYWGVLQFTFESLFIRLKLNAVTSLSFTAIFAAIILFGPFTAGIIALFTAVTLDELKNIRNANPLAWLFNAIQYSISAMITGITYKALGGLIFSEINRGFTISNFPEQLVPLLSSIIVFYFVNTILVSIAISFNEGVSILNVWKMSFSWGDLNYVALGFMGIIFAQIYHLERFALILLIVPIAISRQTFSRYMKLEKAYTETVGALVKAIEAKDKYTRGHSERVAALSVKIARKLNLPEDQVEDLGRIATLHDIGKIGIPKKILDKPDKLSDEEFLKIKEHPKIGAKILKDVPFLQDLIPAVYYHHEKFDGSGYASGLSGSNIPLFARIIAIADSYDAMTSDRAYRKAMTNQKVMDQLLTNSGSQFDAKIVQALLEVLDIKIDEKKKNRLQTAPNFS